ncbi:MAG: acyltransferase [Bacteroidales bacterium]|nr:acyltransferase [Bacteroidales bacterium]
MLVGEKYVSLGKDVTVGKHVQLTAWDRFLDQRFTPSIVIGDGCSIGDGAHITAVNCIELGKNVLTGKYVLITDNSHGGADPSMLSVAPNRRPVVSKGPVIIGDNVWIGEKASILPGVRIGDGAIIGAGAVVTKDVPAGHMAVGVPARVISLEKSAGDA